MESGGAGAGVDGGGGELSSNPQTAMTEALKRNTDCVYFLASPLTCKKGSECEYRHSEGVRFNSRDCWYWFNGNCLNPKCSFRHPPLDGLFEGSGAKSASASGQTPLDSDVSIASTSLTVYAASYNSNKQNVPCYYFQKGHCIKGSRCPFMHNQLLIGNSEIQQVAVTASPTDLPSTKVKRVPKQSEPELRGAKARVVKETEVLPNSREPVLLACSAPTNNFAPEESPPYTQEDDLIRFGLNNVPFENDNTRTLTQSRTSHSLDERVQNGRESDEFLGESSPGFDVLVDDQVEESDYFQNEDEYGKSPAKTGINFVSEFEYQQPDYQPVHLDGDQYIEMREYDRYGHIHNPYGHEKTRRPFEKPRIHDRKMLHREERYDNMDRSDLRHHLSKRRRTDDSRQTTVTADLNDRGNEYNRNRSHVRQSRRDDQCYPRESSISSRLRGRLTIPASASPDQTMELQREMDKEWQRSHRRLSPGRRIKQQAEHRGRHKRRLKEYSKSSEGRASHHTFSSDDAENLNFDGPKSLAELKSSKILKGSQYSKTRKDLDVMKSEDSLSFEAPKRLSEVLKRKRQIESCGGSDSSYSDRAISENHSKHSEKPNNILASKVTSSLNDEENGEEEGMISIDDAYLSNDRHVATKQDTYENEDGMIERNDENELDNYVQKAEESDYEEVVVGAYKEGNFQSGYLDNDEDDEDDFAKKVGVMLS